MTRRIVLLFIGVLSLFLSEAAYAQKMADSDLKLMDSLENKMLIVVDSMYNAPIPDTRAGYATQLARLLVTSLKLPNSYYYPFTKLADKINLIAPEDNSFRIFNWTVQIDELILRYYGAIQMQSEQLKLYGLIDHTNEMTKQDEEGLLTPAKWFGCLYYRIITHEVEGKNVYTLFGVNRGKIISNKKVLDPLTFTPDGPVFGAPIFSVPGDNGEMGMKNRFILEYKKEVQASMNWDDELKMIMFDKLISQVNDPNRKYTYVPSGQYDGFKWVGERWDYVYDLRPALILKDQQAPGGKPDEK